jgi:hypothetical protein
MFRARTALLIAATFGLCCAAATAGTITHEIVLQPIQVQSDDGSIRATVDLYEAETDAVYMQGGIDVRFLPTVELRNTALLTRTSTNVFDLFLGAGNGQHPDPNVLNVWYVDDLRAGGIPARGLAGEGFNGIAVNGNLNQPLVLAHLIGHNLELEPTRPGGHSDDPTNIMHIPPGPNLSPQQIDFALASPFSASVPPTPPPSANAVPLPGAAWGGIGLLGLIAVRRRILRRRVFRH